VATNHDLAEGLQLIDTPGWQTLRTILQESGERPPKREWFQDLPLNPHPTHSTTAKSLNSSHGFLGEEGGGDRDRRARVDDEQLAKRFKGATSLT